MDETQNPQASSKTPRTMLKVVLFGIVVLLLGGNIYLYSSWQSSKDKLKPIQAQLSVKDSSIQKLDSQLKATRDTVRKKDIALFAGVIQAYNKANNGHLTTEGSISKNIYDTQLSKSVKDFTDPTTGDVYGFVGIAPVQSPPPLKVGVIQYQWPGKCGTKTVEDTTDQSLTAVATLLEDGSMYCVSI